MKNNLTKVLLVLSSLIPVSSLQAETFSIFSPIVEKGEIGVELRYANVIQGEPAEEGSQGMALALEWGFSERWRVEIVTEYEAEKSMSAEHEAYEIEFVRNLSEQGKNGRTYNSAFVIGAGLASEATVPDTLEFGYYFGKGFGEKENEV